MIHEERIVLSDEPPILIDQDQWPIIAKREARDGPDHLGIVVREHADGRRIVYGWRSAAGPGDPPDGATAGGYLLTDQCPDHHGTVTALRRLGGILSDHALAHRVIGMLPAREYK